VLSKRQKENTHITCENIPLEGRRKKVAELVKTTAITFIGLAGAPVKAFAMIILPAVLFASVAS
jgi:hypothetical protein